MILKLKNIDFTAIKVLFFSEDVEIINVLVSNKISSGKKIRMLYKYFIGYLHDDYKIKPLHIMLPKTKVYVQIYDGQTKQMYFLIKDDNLLDKYNTIWDKFSSDIKKGFDSELAYNKKSL